MDHQCQLNGYRMAHEEEHKKDCFDEIQCLRFDKETGEFESHSLEIKDDIFLSKLVVRREHEIFDKEYRDKKAKEKKEKKEKEQK